MVIMKKLIYVFVMLVGLQTTFAATEFYLKINSTGNYQVSFAGQLQTTSTNEFRFHGLPSGIWTLAVMNDTGTIVYTCSIVLSDGFRLVAQLNNLNNLQLIGSFQVSTQSWYMDVYNNGFQNTTTVDNYNFGLIKEHLLTYNNTENKLKAAKEITRNNRLTSQQITEICGLFKYEYTRLEYAKFAYDYVIDRGMYFLIYTELNYYSDSELQEYIANH
jgi:hypothetical protein